MLMATLTLAVMGLLLGGGLGLAARKFAVSDDNPLIKIGRASCRERV